MKLARGGSKAVAGVAAATVLVLLAAVVALQFAAPSRLTAPVEFSSLSDADGPVVAQLQPSVVRIVGSAAGCRELHKGTGFVVAPERLMTNAHVVAGVDAVAVESTVGRFDTQVVALDTNNDIAILAAPGLPAPPIEVESSPPPDGTDAIVLGYPEGGPYAAAAVRIRDLTDVRTQGGDGQRPADRHVYVIQGIIREGHSGSPLVNKSGNLVGVVFARAENDADTGFALPIGDLAQALSGAAELSSPVPTGSVQCGGR